MDVSVSREITLLLSDVLPHVLTVLLKSYLVSITCVPMLTIDQCPMLRDKPFIGDEHYMLSVNNGKFVMKSLHKRQSVSLTVNRGT